MPVAQLVTAPDGDRWRVRRRWSDRPPPRLRRLEWRDEPSRADWLTGPADACAASDDFLVGILLAIGVAVLAALLVFVVLPLLGLALELGAVIVLFGSGLFGRLFLRRPWTVEAVNLDRPAESATFAVKGWRPSSRAVLDLAGAIQQSGLPRELPDAPPLLHRA